MKVIEVLYIEFGNMYGEAFNPMFLEKSCKDVKVIYTKLTEEPYFVKHKVDMIYISNLRDSKMYDILNVLKKYKDRLKELIENNTIFLLTGNSLELFGFTIAKQKIKHNIIHK